MERQTKIECSVDEWLKRIKEYPEPHDDLERTKAQYDIICSLSDKKDIFKRDLIAIPALVVSIILSTIISMFCHPKHRKVDAVGLIVESSKVANLKTLGIPDPLKKQYKNIVLLSDNRRVHLISSGVNKQVWNYFIVAVRKYYNNPYLLLSIWMHITKASNIINKYSPRAIISTESEKDFSSTYVTAFCESNGVNNVCVMHGEYLVTPLHAFVRFSQYYIWDEFYIKQFKIVRSPNNQFLLFYPNRFKMNINKKERFYLTYYLQAENHFQLVSIKKALNEFTKRGYACCLRPHPRATDMNQVKKVFANDIIEIEDVNKVSIEESLSRTKYIVSKYSTVLSEAIENGLEAVIDDYTDQNMYKYLNKVLYINISRVRLRMSDLINQIQNEGMKI